MLEQRVPGMRLLRPDPISQPRPSASPLDRLWRDASTISLRTGEVLFSEGSKITYIYRLLNGRVDIFREQINGNPIPLYHVGTGDYLVEASFGKQHDTSARCTTSGTLQRLPVVQFHALLRQDCTLGLALCQKLAGDVSRLRRTSQQRDRYAAPLRDRILVYLAEYADPVSGTLDLPYTLISWARELGVANETLSRVLRLLESAGMLERPSPRTFIIPFEVSSPRD